MIRVSLERCTIARHGTNSVMALKETDNCLNDDHMHNRKLLLYSGIWPYQRPSTRLLRTRIVTLILVLSVLMQVRNLMKSEFTLGSIVEVMETLLPTLTITISYCNMCNNYVTVKLLLDGIRKKWNETNNKDELKSMLKHAEETKVYLLIASCIIFIYSILLTFQSVVHVILYTAGVMNESQLILPLPVVYSANDKIHFFLLLIIQYVFIFTVCSIAIVYSTMHVSFVQHASSLFDIAMIKVDEPFKKNPNNFYWVSSNNKNGGEYEWIVTVIKCYNEAIDFLGLIKIICEKSLLYEACVALLFMVVDVLYLLQLDMLENLRKTVHNCIYIGGSLILTFAYCYLGQKMIDQNNNLLTKCCQVPIYALSLKTQKIIFLLTTRIMKPCHFSVKGTLIVSHETFLSVLRSSYTFATVFYNM